MKLDHKVRECEVQGKMCKHGEKDKHYRTICLKKFNQDGDQENDTSALKNIDYTESGIKAIGEKVIMQTSLMTIKGNDSIITTQAIFNTGITRSYLTEDVANLLMLKPIEEQKVSVYAFGDTKSKQKKQKTAAIVELKIQTRFGNSIKTRANVAKQISGLLQTTTSQLKNQRVLKKQYDLVYTLPSQIERYTLEMLIANDHFYDIMLDKGEVVQENRGIKIGMNSFRKSNNQRIAG